MMGSIIKTVFAVEFARILFALAWCVLALIVFAVVFGIRTLIDKQEKKFDEEWEKYGDD